jgi:hypothetical protein
LTRGGNCVNRFTVLHRETSFGPLSGRAKSWLAKMYPWVPD